MIDPKLVRLLTIFFASGAAGSLLALLPLLFRKKSERVGYGTTAGIGFLVGAAIGGMFGVFGVLLNQF